MHSTPTIDKKTWNELANHPMQSWEWGEVKKRVGTPIVRYAFLDDDHPAAYLMTIHPVPLLGVMAYCGRSAWPTSKQAQSIRSYLLEKGCMMAKFEPALVAEQAGEYQIPLINRSFMIDHIRYTQSQSTIFAPHTFTLNLIFTKEELLSHMKSKTRYNIRLATRIGVTVRDTTEEPKGLEEFFDLYRQTIGRQRYFGRNHDYMKTLWDELGGSMARIYTAYYEGIPLSSYMIFY
ncbi:MAG: aminoacyltransferase, partial [Candidatus Roizmanbacteria bacterium]|nr:aminoacyltransferase [Candidatus Roizmanbacteria bacterium]